MVTVRTMVTRQSIESALFRLVGPKYREHRYLIAVSGGVDSMVLMDLMMEAIPLKQLRVAHFNHAVRGYESDEDASLVRAEASRRGVAFIWAKRTSGKTSEEALRVARNRFLESARKKSNAHFTVTAHHSGDQLETFLMRLIRGTGLDGLAGIRLRRDQWLHPLLELSKEELTEYAKSRKILYREDRTNLTESYFRNRVRHRLVPAIRKLSLEFGGNRRFEERFRHTLGDIQWAVDGLERRTRLLYRRLCVETPFWIRLEWHAWNQLANPWQYRLIRHIGAKLGNPSLTRAQASAVIRSLRDRERRAQFFGHLDYVLSCDHIFFRNAAQRERLRNGLSLKRASHRVFNRELKLSLHLSSPGERCEVRFPKNGDRFENKKLKEVFLRRRIPQPERALVPVLAEKNSGKIRWVFPDPCPGIFIDQAEFPFSFRLTPDAVSETAKRASRPGR